MNDLFNSECDERSAVISECGLYRYALRRVWNPDPSLPTLGWIMLNPSTADAMQDDPTIRRCVSFAKAWGFRGIEVRNLFALRATDPRELYKASDPVGPDNDAAILEMDDLCSLVIASWGVHGSLRSRDKSVEFLLRMSLTKLKCLGKTKDGHPKHPLYVAANNELILYP